MGLTINDCIIDSIERKREWFYHGISGDESTYDDIFKNGLKSPILLHKSGSGWNGSFYVSISKKCDIDLYKSSYKRITEGYPAIIIDGIHPIYADPNRLISFVDSIIPLRTSEYLDEYQHFLKINSKYFVGIQHSLYLFNHDFESREYMLNRLDKLLEYLITYKIDLPFYGYDENEYDLLLMDKEKTRKLIRENCN